MLATVAPMRTLARLSAAALLALTAASALAALPAAANPPSRSAPSAAAPAVAAAGTASVSTDVDDFTFDAFDAEYTLSREPDGTATLLVTETIVARFPEFDQNRGIIRAIPDDYDGVPLDTSVVSVTDQNGVDVYYESVYSGGFVELYLGTDEFVRGEQTYVITYTQQNVVRSFDDTASDEFYWDVNGTGWQQPFDRVSATVTLAPDVAAALTGNAACYVGPQGSTESCPIERADAGFTANATDLAPGETLTVAIGFAPGTFLTPEPTPPPEPQEVPLWMHLLSGGVGVASLGALGAAIASRVRAGSGARSRGAIIPQYSEPEGFDIVQAAHLIGRPASGVPAAIVRLAVRKNLRILAYAVENDAAPYTLQYLSDDRTDALDLALLEALFGVDRAPGDLAPYGEYDATLATRLTDLQTRAGSSIIDEGFKRTAPGIGFGWLMLVAQWACMALAGAAIIVSGVLFVNVSSLAFPSLAGAFIAGFIAFVLAIRPQQFTEKGREARDYLEGMKLYLTVAEDERLRVLQSPQGAERIDVGNDLELVKLYEKLLPWAVVWGVEDRWMRELAVHVAATDTTPDWFIGTNGFDAALFSAAVRGVTATTIAPSSSWSSSGGGSFSGGSFGGGFSGGGGGGGGGGGR